MEIHFCARCNESIPEGDFDTGRAVAVGDSHYHVACALSQSLSRSGSRSWLTFVLALYAAAVTTFLLVGALQPAEDPNVVPPAVEARIEEATDALLETSRRERESRVTELSEGEERLRKAAAKALEGAVEKSLAGVTSGLQALTETTSRSESELLARLRNNEADIGGVSKQLRQAIQRLAALEAAPAPAPPEPFRPPVEPTPVAPEPTPPTPEPETPADPERDKKLEEGLAKLKSSDVNTRFEGTLELGTLKDLRAAPHLIAVLDKDKDYYVRLGAATALGDLQACDAVLALVEALEDKDSLVRTAANDALLAITGHGIDFRTEMKSREVRKVQKDWRDWWKENEAVVRRRLDQ